jgi:excisionase family DNA binding protein
MHPLQLKNSSPKPLAYTKEEAKFALRCGLSTIDRLIAAGTLRTFYLGKSVRITADSVEALVDGRGRPRSPVAGATS